jgi:hypothetical protein
MTVLVPGGSTAAHGACIPPIQEFLSSEPNGLSPARGYISEIGS